MKVKLTETQYNRLLTETQQVGDKVTPFVVKMFKLIENKVGLSTYFLVDAMHFLMNTMSLSVNDALVVATTYEKFREEEMTEWDNLIGKPLQTKKVYGFKTSVPVMASMYARGYGVATVYALGYSEKDALENVLDHQKFSVEIEDEDNIDWDTDIEDIEINTDMMLDDMSDEYPDVPNFKLSNDIPNWELSNLIKK